MVLLLRIVVCIGALVEIVIGQGGIDWTPDPNWAKPTMEKSMEDRRRLFTSGLEEATNWMNDQTVLGDTGSGPSTLAQLFVLMAEYDILTKQQKYRGDIARWMRQINGTKPFFADEFVRINFGVHYGFAAVKAYSAYGDEYFLDLAKGVWQFGLNWTITDAAITSGRMQGKNFAITANCGNVEPTSNKGGTFWRQDANNTDVIALASGEMMYLSALIAEAEKSATSIQYTQAHDTYNWIRSHLVNTTVNLVRGGVKIGTQDNCETAQGFPADGAQWFIEGLSVLRDIQAVKDPVVEAHWMNIMKGITMWPEWHQTGGVNTVGTRSSPSRAAFAAYRRISGTDESWAPMRKYLEAYMSNQFNALLDRATIPGSNLYGISPAGPRPGAELNLLDQMHGLGILFNTLFMPELQGLQKGTDTLSTKTAPIGPIVGGVIGGIAFLVLLGLLVLFLRRRKSKKTYEARKQGMHIDSIYVEPFDVTSSPYVKDGNAMDRLGSGKPLLGTPPLSQVQIGVAGATIPSGGTGLSGEIRPPHSRERSEQNFIGFLPITTMGRGEKRAQAQQQISSSSGMTQTYDREITPISTPPSSQSVPSSRPPASSQSAEDNSLRTGRPPPLQSPPVHSPDDVARALPTERLVKELYERMHASGTEEESGAPPGYRA